MEAESEALTLLLTSAELSSWDDCVEAVEVAEEPLAVAGVEAGVEVDVEIDEVLSLECCCC